MKKRRVVIAKKKSNRETQPTGPLYTYQYRMEATPRADVDAAVTQINALGAQGWRVVAVTPHDNETTRVLMEKAT